MKAHEFFSKYANTPLEDRFTILDFNKAGIATLNSVYKEMAMLEDAMRPLKIREEELLKLVEPLLKKKAKPL